MSRTTDTPWMKMDEAIHYLRLGSEAAVRRLIREHRLPNRRLGRKLMFHRDELDAYLRAEDPIAGHLGVPASGSGSRAAVGALRATAARRPPPSSPGSRRPPSPAVKAVGHP